MRIIGGQWRGLRLAEVGTGDAAAHLRPTADRVREAIFNLLINGGYGDPVSGARVLDLFAGTGALGLEALSRGAAHATFLDAGATALALLRRNIGLTRAADRATVLRRDAERPGDNPGAPHALVFLDPPYGRGLGPLALAAATPWLTDDALVVLEDNGPCPAPPGYTRLDQRRYGDTHVTLLVREPVPPTP